MTAFENARTELLRARVENIAAIVTAVCPTADRMRWDVDSDGGLLDGIWCRCDGAGPSAVNTDDFETEHGLPESFINDAVGQPSFEEMRSARDLGLDLDKDTGGWTADLTPHRFAALGIDPRNTLAREAVERAADWRDLTPESREVQVALAMHKNP